MQDVTVFGAGIWGFSIAYACLRRGARVRVVDPRGIAAGASGGVVGALAPHAPEGWNEIKAFQLDALLMAETFWTGVAQTGGGAPGYARLGRWQPIPDAAALARARDRAAQAATLWRGSAEWRVIERPAGDDWAPASGTGRLIEDSLSARLHPRRSCLALAAAIEVLGGEIAAEPGMRPGAQIWATGWEGLAALGADLGRMAGSGVKGQAAVLGSDRRGRPQIYADGVHIVPHEDGTVAVGSTSERDYADPFATDARLEEVLARARRLCPALADAPVLRRWAGLRPRSRSRQPLLGRWPGRAGQFVANGGFKIGFGLAPLIGEVMADLVLEGRDRRPEPFRTEAQL